MSRNWVSIFGLVVSIGCGGKLTVDGLEPGRAPDGGVAGVDNLGSAATETMTGGTETGGSAVGGKAHGGESSTALGGEPTSTGAIGGATAGNAGSGGSGGRANEGGSGGNGMGQAGEGGALVTAGAGGEAGAPSCDDVPGDCHEVTCNQDGIPSRQVDQSDVPVLSNPCMAGTCNASGQTGSEPRDARYACQGPNNGAMCDGTGACVECLLSADCPDAQNCNKQHACTTDACTDVDCGGVCPACDNGKKCEQDTDCASYACDSVTKKCIADHCTDHHHDWDETDLDCGGGVCKGCQPAQKCVLNYDCASNACDATSQICITDQCADHHVDNSETDIDCGGNTCAPCDDYHRCSVAKDCASGICYPYQPHMCVPPGFKG